jgi:hypothetical protein
VRKSRPPDSKLVVFNTDEVSVVPMGANNKRFCLRKSEEQMNAVIKACLDNPMDNEAAIDERLAKEGVEEKAGEAIKSALRILDAFKDELREEDLSLLAELAGAPAAAPAEEEPAPLAPFEAKEEATEKAAVAKSENRMTLAPEVKAQLETLAKARDAQKAQIEALEKQLKEREDAEKTRACIEKAAKEFPHLGPATKLGPVLKRLEEAGLYAEVENVLKGANARTDTSAIFKEFGSPHTYGKTEGDDPAARLNKAAADIASAKQIPIWKAHQEACAANPDLYEAIDPSRRRR